MGTLQYDEKTSCFYYGANGMKPVEGSHVQHTGLGDFYVFRDEFPRNVMALKSFGLLNKGATASEKAMQAVARVKNVQSLLDNPQAASAHASLFSRQPYQHQASAIEYMMHYKKLMLILEQGLGKTFISYMAVRLWKEQGIPHRTLVVCPRIVLPNWMREVEAYTDMHILPYYGSPQQREECRRRLQNENWDMIVTTFDMLTRKGEATLHTYAAMWQDMDETQRSRQVEKWLLEGVVGEDEKAVLLSDLAVKKNADAAAHILKGIPKGKMPPFLLGNAKKADDSVTFLSSLGWDNLIVDEASRCLNVKSQRSNAIDAMAAKAKRIYMLSGTLCVGRPTDLYMPCRILDPSIINMNWTRFKDSFCIFRDQQKHIITGYKNLEKLKMLTDPYMLTMTREQCLDMPERVFVQRYYDVTAAQRDLYNEIVTSDWIDTGEGEGVATELTLQKLTKCMQVLSGFIKTQCNCKEVCGDCPNILQCLQMDINPGTQRCIHSDAQKKDYRIIELDNGKLRLLEEDLEDLDGQKVIVWAWYRHDLACIADFLRSRKIGFVTAGAPDCDTKFNADKNIQVFLGQTRQGIGITLNAAKVTIYYSHGPDLEARLQSLDRNYRIGQRNNVVVHDYVCAGSVEESMLALLSHKEEVKSFMQTDMACAACTEMQKCLSSGRRSRNCPFAEDIVEAERKKTLAIPLL